MKFKKYIPISVLTFLILCFGTSLTIKVLSKNNSTFKSTEIKEAKTPIVDNWKYKKYSDSKIEIASCISNNSLVITQRNTKFKLEIIAENIQRNSYVTINFIDKNAGGFVTNQRDTQFVTLQFDNENKFNVDFVSPPTEPGDKIYLMSYDKIIYQLRKSKKLTVNAEIRNVGWKYIEFEVENFKL